MRNLLVTFLTLLSVLTYSQSKGKISGNVKDKDLGLEPLPFVSVYVEGNAKVGTTTDFDGNYTLPLLPGKHVIVFDFVGYKPVKKAINVQAGKAQTVSVVMETLADALDAIVITATTNKASETALIADQKEATIIIESIGAEQLSNQGVSDAAAATTKVTGVSKQQGSSKVYVRGLGDRYNSTTLNGLPLPSNDPSLKNISLDLFSTDILQNVGISKTFSSNITGDFSGANINIETKKASSKSNLSVGVSLGGNSQTLFKDFKNIDGANYIGIESGTERLIVPGSAGRDRARIRDVQVYPFQDNFSPDVNTAGPNVGISLSGGKKHKFNNGSSLSYFLVGSFDNNFRLTEGSEINNRGFNDDGTLSVGSRFTDAKIYSYSTNKLLMGNFEYKINKNHKILYNSILIHSNSQKIEDYFGSNNDIAQLNVVQQTQDQNVLLVNQLISENTIGEYLDLRLGLAYNDIKNDQPNRKRNVFRIDDNGNASFATGTARNNSRYYHNLEEEDVVGKLDTKIYLGKRDEDTTKGFVDFGYLYRNTERNFEAIYYDHDLSSSSSVIVDRNNVSAVLNQDGLTNGVFSLLTGLGFGRGSLRPFSYDGTRDVHAVNAAINYNFLEDDKLFISLGGRFESIDQEVSWFTNLTNGVTRSSSIDETYILPSLNVKYSFNEQQQLRFSASQTYTFPQFKEIAEFVYEGANYQEQGNANLKPSDNYNVDVKYEYFPKDGSLISATVFGKLIQNSINRIELNAAADNVYSYSNTGDAEVLGVELEYRGDIATFGDDTSEDYSKLRFGANTTLMYTNQDFEQQEGSLFNPTNTSAQLEGAAPVIVNLDLLYKIVNNDSETSFAAVFNYQHDKLYSIGSNSTNNSDLGLQDIIQNRVYILDFVAKHAFNKKASLKLAVKNILNTDLDRERDLDDPVTNVSYKRGVDFSLSFGYKF